MPPQMRHQFAYLCIFGELTNALALWEEFREDMILDFLRNYDEDSAINLALHDLQSVFQQHGVACSRYQLPTPTGNVADQQPHNQVQQQLLANSLIQTLNVEQRQAFEQIVDGVTNPSATKLFYLNGPGGSGKMYLYRTIISYLESLGLTVLATATTGIASTLMQGGRTVHSAFGLPLKLDANSISQIRSGSIKALALVAANLIIIDEVTMMTKEGLRVIN